MIDRARTRARRATMQHARKAVAVVGGGTMGAGIAAGFLAGGWNAWIVNPPDAVSATIDARLRGAIAQLGAEYDGAAIGRSETLAGVPWQDIDLVVEAAPERLDVKRGIFAELERRAKPDTPLCSNSSALPIGRIGEGLATASRMVGAHYFMPAHLVPGVEVVQSGETDPAVADRVAGYLESIGKVAIRVRRDLPGFLANRLQHALAREAFSLIERGIATPEDIDNAVRYAFGFRYIAAGPVLQKDHAGLDVHAAAAATVYPDLCNAAVPSRALTDLVAAGHLGMKTGRGFYEWPPARIAAEKARYETALAAAGRILDAERKRS
jgi:3-hydroxybutyryl-CoA dehydrogenase